MTTFWDFNLVWSYYLKLVRIENDNERIFNEIEYHKNNWSVRELQRQQNITPYTRLSIGRKDKRMLCK